MNTGWEVRPLGWVLLALLASIVLYYAITRLTSSPNDDLHTH